MTQRHLPKAPPVRRFGHAPPVRREGTRERVRRMGQEYERTERPFDPERPGSWRGSARDLVVNSRKRFRDTVYDAQGNRVDLPDVKITVERVGYELVPLRGHAHTLAVRDVNGNYIGWMPVEVTGQPTVKEWIATEGYVANGDSLSGHEKDELAEYAERVWRSLTRRHEDGEGEPIMTRAEYQKEVLRVAAEEEPSYAMTLFNELFEGFGVESIGPVDMREGPPFVYVNQGDTYNETIIWSRDDETYLISTPGDVWENGGEEKVLEEAWEGYIGQDFERALVRWFEEEPIDEDAGITRQGLTESQVEHLAELAEEKVQDEGLAFFQKALWGAQQERDGGRGYPEVEIGSSEVFVHHMDAVVDKAAHMIIDEWRGGAQLSFKFNRRR